MKAESEVSILFAKSIFLDKFFTPDDDTLDYESYKKLGLTCGKCRELIFFKQGTERVNHFSHFRDTGKDCDWKTESYNNTQYSDSCHKQQSLKKFQIKFKGIVERAMIKYQQISSFQLVRQIVKGKMLGAEYNVNIKLWLQWFNKNENRSHIENVVLGFYQNNNLLSSTNSRVLVNLLDYLCVSASEDILRDLLYYVVFLLNKKICVDNDCDEVRSKVIEIISFVNWEKECVNTNKLEQNAHKDLVDFSKNENAPISFQERDPFHVEKKTPKSQIKVERQTLKPIKLDGSKVAQGAVIFRSVVGTTPLLACLVPSGKEWKLIGLPVKVPEYNLAEYVVGNLSENQAIAYLEREIDRLKNQYDVNSLQLIARLKHLLNQVVEGKKLPPESLRQSTIEIKKYLDKAEFKHDSFYTDNYYKNHTLGDVSFIQELETEKLIYTFVWGTERATWQSEVPTVIKWLKRVPTLLGKQFPINFPSFEEIRDYLQSIFKFENVELIIKQERGIYIEIYYKGSLQTRQLLDITRPVAKDKIRNQVSTKVSTSIQYVGEGEFYSLLRCTSADRQLVRDAKAQLTKIVDKFLSANKSRFVGNKRVFVTTKIPNIVGFMDTGDNYSHIAKTFLEFIRPFTLESPLNLGKLIDLKTDRIYSEHDTTQLLEFLTKQWKYWDKREALEITLGGQNFKKQNPAQLMLNVHNLLIEQPHLDTLVWRDLIDVFYQLSKLPVGFRCFSGVVLTPYNMYTSHVERWTHKIKVQLIDLLLRNQHQLQKDVTLKTDKVLLQQSRTGKMERWFQMSIEALYTALEKLQPNWENKTSPDVLKHLEALHETLVIVEEIEASFYK